MPDLTKEPARQLALNTDWLTASGAAAAFFVCEVLEGWLPLGGPCMGHLGLHPFLGGMWRLRLALSIWG